MTPPRLDDAQLGTVTLATTEDLARLERAKDHRRRHFFAGATFPNPEGGLLTFTKGEYDAFVEYSRKLSLGAPVPPINPSIPILRITFSTRRLLVEPAPSAAGVSGRLYPCAAGASDDAWPLSAEIMSRDRFLTQDGAEDIVDYLDASDRPEDYEVMIHHANWDPVGWKWGAPTMTLLPPPGDLCFALMQINWPVWTPTTGKPLRIPEAMINAALGPLPRVVPFDRSEQPGYPTASATTATTAAP